MQVLINGLLFGSLLALAAAGLALIFGVMRVVNLAHGEFLAIGAFLGVFAIGAWGWPLWGALAVTLAGGALVGWLLQRLLLRHVVGKEPLKSLLLTFGLSMALLGGLSVTFTGDVRRYASPLEGSITILGLRFTQGLVITAFIAAALFAALIAMLFWTKTGAGLRATAQHRDAAAACGVNLARIDAVAVAISVAAAGAAGLLLSLRYVVRPEFGQSWLLHSIIVIVLGGMGSLYGAAIAGLAVGTLFVVVSYSFGSVFAQLVLYSAIFVLLLVRPQGFAGATS